MVVGQVEDEVEAVTSSYSIVERKLELVCPRVSKKLPSQLCSHFSYTGFMTQRLVV